MATATAAKQTHHVGKKKSACARIYFRQRAGETGTIRVNRRSFEEYFPRATSRLLILQPLELTNMVGRYDVYVNVNGGGLSGQAGAVRHAIARALVEIDASLRPALKKAGMMTRDAREVERKKYGMAGARKRFQFSKR